jgi:hypothetical protein
MKTKIFAWSACKLLLRLLARSTILSNSFMLKYAQSLQRQQEAKMRELVLKVSSFGHLLLKKKALERKKVVLQRAILRNAVNNL